MERDKSKYTENVVLREAVSGATKIQPFAEGQGGGKKISPKKTSSTPPAKKVDKTKK